MGFLKRLFGGGVDDPATQLTLNLNYFARIRDDAALEVVGEAYRQEFVALARPPTGDDLPPEVPQPPAGLYKATLMPQPSNQYDRNAIAVTLWAGGSWALAGYLSRDDAVAYQPLFRHLATTSGGTTPAITCDAALKQEHGGSTGVVLHLGTPGECAVELATDDLPEPAHPLRDKTVVFTGDRATTILGVPLDREGQHMLARWAGCDILPRLTKKTDALIVADRPALTGNLQRAKEFGVVTIDEPDFVASVGIPAEAIGRVSGRWTKA